MRTKSPRTITAYRHHNPNPPAVEIDPEPGNYYVSVRDGPKTGILAGPFRHHADAVAIIPRTSAVAEACDAFAAFYAFGSVRMKDTYTKPGILNERLGLVVGADGFVICHREEPSTAGAES